MLAKSSSYTQARVIPAAALYKQKQKGKRRASFLGKQTRKPYAREISPSERLRIVSVRTSQRVRGYKFNTAAA